MPIYYTTDNINYLVQHGCYPDAHYALNEMPAPQNDNRVKKLQATKTTQHG